MEGRTIVRPDSPGCLSWRATSSAFNGGPDNRPARLPQWTARSLTPAFLQWRAGQSSGQTSMLYVLLSSSHDPSMEGRTIVRPDMTITLEEYKRRHPSMEGRTIVRPDTTGGKRSISSLSTFNGGPDNRPARLVLYADGVWGVGHLQWRAGQSSGQTRRYASSRANRRLLQWRAGQSSGQTRNARMHRGANRRLQWRAGQSSGQTCRGTLHTAVETCPSMEGRTIVRPDMQQPLLMCRQQKPFNGGPDNRPARRGGGVRGVDRTDRPSMEGRTIVRPDPIITDSELVQLHPSMEGRTIVRPD